MSFALGQRWISNTESELGLGTVVDCQSRTVTLLFPATGESRTYTLATAPLTRVTFAVDDKVRSHEGWQMVVSRVEEQDELLIYHGQRLDNQKTVALRETLLDHHFQLDKPEQRLFNGQFDDPKWFDLRLGCLQQQYQHQTSALLGMTGARVDLIPHQLHIANEVASRFAPRVLLADEVGLGKTIEAALILHRQILTGRASRVLILVPDSLVHQWLVEMRRRVNLAFAIFDQERFASLQDEADNPFESEQLVLCSLDFLAHNDKVYQHALRAGWDLLIVDEAHHLRWSSTAPSIEYQVVEGLAAVTKGVLLLTATPDQLGHESHFARLRLLDPARFHDYQAFLAEEQQYAALASAIGPLLEGQPLDDLQIAAIAAFAPEEQSLLKRLNQASNDDKQRLLNHLIDRHGTGRILFRNSRCGIQGFPRRKLHAYALPQPEVYKGLTVSADNALRFGLTPERHPQVENTWIMQDPRVDWFIRLLGEHKGEKVLTICASAATALQLAEALRLRAGIRAGVFHEGQSIVERDRVANFFAQSEDGAQVLICSEIGSEGRNFQFAHHLVLFDLPLVPDLLEQRIGRLDRIGQTQDVQIHVPYFEDSPQALLLDWYHQGLNAFEQTCPTGTAVFEQVENALQACLLQTPGADFSALLAQTQDLHQRLKRKLEAGRDRLLELNSSGRDNITPLLEAIREQDQSPRLERFMTSLFDALGILQEENDETSYFLRPGESMVNQLPGLDEEGITITYERATALTREDVHFFSADHPMVQHALDMLLTDTLGKSSIALSNNQALPNGSYFIECLFVLSARAEKGLQLQRFLPPTPIRLCLDAQGKVQDITFNGLQGVNAKMGQQLIQALNKPIEAALGKARAAADKQAAIIRQQAMTTMQQQCGDELDRLLTLKKLNPSIRDEEIQHQARQLETLGQLITQSTLALEAIRLVVNSH